jgi:hypothetical protein
MRYRSPVECLRPTEEETGTVAKVLLNASRLDLAEHAKGVAAGPRQAEAFEQHGAIRAPIPSGALVYLRPCLGPNRRRSLRRTGLSSITKLKV